MRESGHSTKRSLYKNIFSVYFVLRQKLQSLIFFWRQEEIPTVYLDEAKQLIYNLTPQEFLDLQKDVMRSIAATYYHQQAYKEKKHQGSSRRKDSFNIYDMVKNEDELSKLVFLSESAWRDVLVQMVGMSLHALHVLQDVPEGLPRSEVKLIDVVKLRRSCFKLVN
jgi:hypothetical protein